MLRAHQRILLLTLLYKRLKLITPNKLININKYIHIKENILTNTTLTKAQVSFLSLLIC